MTIRISQIDHDYSCGIRKQNPGNATNEVINNKWVNYRYFGWFRVNRRCLRRFRWSLQILIIIILMPGDPTWNYQTRPFVDRDTPWPIPSAWQKSAVATVPGQLSANLLECLCVSLAVLSPCTSVSTVEGKRAYNLISRSLFLSLATEKTLKRVNVENSSASWRLQSN